MQGRSEYLERKGVGYYGIRFRSDEKYGDVAIVPMWMRKDEYGAIRFSTAMGPNAAKGNAAEGLHHMIGKALDGAPNSTLVISRITTTTCITRAENQGRYKAEKAIGTLSENAVIVEPDFDNLNASKEHSDWNDLIRLKGFDNAKMQIQAMLKQQFSTLS